MGKHRPIYVGDKFTLKPNVEVTVTAFYDAKNIEVRDDNGNSRVVLAHDLISAPIVWLRKDGTFKEGKRELFRRDVGTVAKQMRETFAPGTVWDSNKYGSYEVVSIVNSQSVTVKWHSNGGLQSGVSTQAIKTGCVVNKTLEVFVDLTIPEGNYVYMTTISGEVVYIGRGRGDRYKHTISGCSGNKGLNRLFFHGEKLITEVLEQGLSVDDAKYLEKVLIDKYRPKCNQIICKI